MLQFFCSVAVRALLASRHSPPTPMHPKGANIKRFLQKYPPTQEFKDSEFLINFFSFSLLFAFLFLCFSLRCGGEWWRFQLLCLMHTVSRRGIVRGLRRVARCFERLTASLSERYSIDRRSDKTFYPPHPDDYHHSPRMDYLNLLFFLFFFAVFAKMRAEEIIFT